MYIKLLNFNNICNTFVGYVLFTLGVITALPALIHARLHGCAGSSCPEQTHTANPNCMLIGVRCVLFGIRFGFGRVLFRCVLLHAARFPAACFLLFCLVLCGMQLVFFTGCVRAAAGQMGALSRIVLLCPLPQIFWK